MCSQHFLSAYIPAPARDTWSTWRKSLVSWHDSPAETCFSSRYLQPVPPVGLLTGFSKGCNFYLEYVEMEPGDYIVLWWVDLIALQKPVSKFASRYLQLVPHLPVSAMGAISTGSTWRRSLEINCAMVSGHAILAETCTPTLCAASASSRPISRIQQGILGVHGERAWWVDMIALQKPVSHPVICSQCLLFAYWPVSAMGAISTGSTWRRSLEIKLCYGEWTCYRCRNLYSPSSLCLQPALPVGLCPGSSKGYLEYVEKELGELTW